MKGRIKLGMLAVIRLALALAILGSPEFWGPRAASAAAYGSTAAPTSDGVALRRIECAASEGLRAASARIARRLGRLGWVAEVSVSLDMPMSGEPEMDIGGGASMREQVTYLRTARDLLGRRTFRGCVRSRAEDSSRRVDARYISTAVHRWTTDAFGFSGDPDNRSRASDVVSFEMGFYPSVNANSGVARSLTFGPERPPSALARAGHLSISIGKLGCADRSTALGANDAASRIQNASAPMQHP